MALSHRLGEPEALQRSRDVFHRSAGRTALVLAGTDALKQTDLRDHGLGIAYSLKGIASTCGAILKISVHPAWTDECYMLARAYVERCINASYLAISEGAVHDDFVAHAIARRYRSEDQTITLAKTTITVKRSRAATPTPPEVAAALQRFTSKKGRSKNWSDLSLEQRASAVAEAVPTAETLLALAILTINGRASEALHGSLFGLTASSPPQWTETSGRDDSDPFDWSARSGELVAMLVALARTTEALMRVLAVKAGNEMVTAQADALTFDIAAFFASFHNATESGDGGVG